MVAEDAAGQGGGKGSNGQFRRDRLGNRCDDGQQDAEGAPGGAGGEAQESCEDEDHHRENGTRNAQRLEEVADVFGSAEKLTAYTADSPGQKQDNAGGDHGLHALDHTIEELMEVHDLARDIEQQGKEQSGERAPGQCLTGNAVAERRSELAGNGGIIAPKATDVHHCEDRDDDQNQDRENHIPECRVAGSLHSLIILIRRGRKVTAGCLLFKAVHQAEVPGKHADQDDHQQAEDRIEIVRDHGHEAGNAGLEHTGVDHVAADCRAPGGNRDQNADRGRGGVDQIGQLRTAHLISVGDRLHNRTDCQGVEIVVNEDQAAQESRKQGGLALAPDHTGGPAPIGLGAA